MVTVLADDLNCLRQWWSSARSTTSWDKIVKYQLHSEWGYAINMKFSKEGLDKVLQ